MRKILMSLGAMAAVGMLSVGLTTSAQAATGTLYMTQAGQTTTYTDPKQGLCVSSDPAKGDVTFINRTNGLAWTYSRPGCDRAYQVDYLRVGQRLTLPAGWSILMLQ
ncbi:hypothetical protein ACFT8P_35795 [Streptomyces sp. NPDC057101]|uniref:hypothetical protein n=1 Tax=Streptomyces sp. NPDC057101 TaxID=3346020 RepID=UPI0036292B80